MQIRWNEEQWNGTPESLIRLCLHSEITIACKNDRASAIELGMIGLRLLHKERGTSIEGSLHVEELYINMYSKVSGMSRHTFP